MKLTKEQKADAIKKLDTPFGYLELACDGYRVTLQVQRAKGLRYRVMTYINGEFKGIWAQSSTPAPEQKFLNKVTKPLFIRAHKAKMEKVFGKRAVAKDPAYSKTISAYFPDWASGKAAINHLCKVCETIQVIQGEQP